MEGDFVGESSVNQPESELVLPLPLTREAVMKLNNHTVTFERARSLFDVDLSTFKAKLMELNIFVWNEPNGARVRIHGDDDHDITIVIKKINKFYTVRGTTSFYDVTSLVEYDLKLSPESYKLTYKHPQTSTKALLETDRDWHFAVEQSKERGYLLYLNLKTNAANIAAYKAAYKEYASTYDDDASTYDEYASDEDAFVTPVAC